MKMVKRKELFLTISGNILLIILSIVAILYNERILQRLFDIEIEISHIYRLMHTEDQNTKEISDRIDILFNSNFITFITSTDKNLQTDFEVNGNNFSDIIENSIRPHLKVFFSNFIFVNRLLLFMLIIYSGALIVYMVLNKSSQVHQEALSALISRSHEQQEDIRKHVTSELHDDVIQTLAYIKRRSFKGIENQEITESISSVIEKMRTLIKSLNSLEIQRIGLKGVLAEEVRQIHNKSPFPVTISFGDFDDSNIVPKISQHIVRICQEAISNSIKHSKASFSSIRIIIIDGIIKIKISDNGIGFDTKAIDFKSGIGLISIKERVKDCKGTIDINSQNGEGTIFSISIRSWSNNKNSSSR